MEFRKSYVLSLKDYLSYNVFSHRKQIIMMPALFVVLMLAVCFFIVFANRTPDTLALVVVIVLVILFSGLIVLSNILTLNRQAKRHYQASHSLKSEFELYINKDGIGESGRSGNSKASWAQILRAVESKNALYIHVTALQAFVIPKALLSKEEDALIRALLKKHLPRNKYRLRG